MTKTEKYPSWVRVRASLVVSEETRDGTPDFYLVRDKNRWFVKWRTSAHWDQTTYPSLAAAKQSVSDGLKPFWY